MMLIINSLRITWKQRASDTIIYDKSEKEEQDFDFIVLLFLLLLPSVSFIIRATFFFHLFFLCVDDREKIGETNESLGVCMYVWTVLFVFFAALCNTDAESVNERVRENFRNFVSPSTRPKVSSEINSSCIRKRYLWWILGRQSGFVVHLGFSVFSCLRFTSLLVSLTSFLHHQTLNFSLALFFCIMKSIFHNARCCFRALSFMSFHAVALELKVNSSRDRFNSLWRGEEKLAKTKFSSPRTRKIL